MRQVTREQLATLKATADALERGNLDDPVSAHAPPAGPLRTIGLSLGCVLTPMLRCVAQDLRVGMVVVAKHDPACQCTL